VAVANDTFGLNRDECGAPSAKRQVDVMQANTAILTELVKQSELAKVTLRARNTFDSDYRQTYFAFGKRTFWKSERYCIGRVLAGFW
jgi:hypothetical protein